MYNFDEVLTRLNMQKMCSFLLYGTDDMVDIDTRPYEQRRTEAEQPITKLLNDLLGDNESELDIAMDKLSIALTAIQNVYLEIGLRAGAKIMMELVGVNSDK